MVNDAMMPNLFSTSFSVTMARKFVKFAWIKCRFVVNILKKFHYGANSKKYETVIFGSGSNASSQKISMKVTYHKLSHKKGSKLQKLDEINSVLEQFVFFVEIVL